jgi:hypothetical protein
MRRWAGVCSTEALGLVGDDQMPAIDVDLMAEPALYGSGDCGHCHGRNRRG